MAKNTMVNSNGAARKPRFLFVCRKWKHTVAVGDGATKAKVTFIDGRFETDDDMIAVALAGHSEHGREFAIVASSAKRLFAAMEAQRG